MSLETSGLSENYAPSEVAIRIESSIFGTWLVIAQKDLSKLQDLMISKLEFSFKSKYLPEIIAVLQEAGFTIENNQSKR